MLMDGVRAARFAQFSRARRVGGDRLFAEHVTARTECHMCHLGVERLWNHHNHRIDYVVFQCAREAIDSYFNSGTQRPGMVDSLDPLTRAPAEQGHLHPVGIS